MTLDENKEIVRRYIEEAVNIGNVDILDEFISPSYTKTLDPNGKTPGVEVAKQHILGVRQTFPDLHLTIEQKISEGDWVVTCITARGTQAWHRYHRVGLWRWPCHRCNILVNTAVA